MRQCFSPSCYSFFSLRGLTPKGNQGPFIRVYVVLQFHAYGAAHKFSLFGLAELSVSYAGGIGPTAPCAAVRQEAREKVDFYQATLEQYTRRSVLRVPCSCYMLQKEVESRQRRFSEIRLVVQSRYTMMVMTAFKQRGQVIVQEI